MVVTPYPRFYLAELGLTNHSDCPIFIKDKISPLFIKDITATVGTRAYGRPDGVR